MPWLNARRLETLTEDDTLMRTSVFSRAAIVSGAAFFVFAIGTSNGALAAEMKKGAKVITSSSDKVKVRITGQFSREAIYLDDGGSSRMRYQDSNYSSSRFRILTESKINSDIKVGGQLEVGMDDARNALSNTANFAGRSGNDFQTRKTEIWFNHKRFGRGPVQAKAFRHHERFKGGLGLERRDARQLGFEIVGGRRDQGKAEPGHSHQS